MFCRDIDEIVLSYVANILQDLSSGSCTDEEAFDVDAFCEMLFAYLPETACIPPVEITEWMFTLAKEQRDLQLGKFCNNSILCVAVISKNGKRTFS